MLNKLIHHCWNSGIHKCETRAVELADKCKTYRIVNIGSCASPRWPSAAYCDARVDGIDFNTHVLPYWSNHFDVVVCEQVIEHLHNTTWFLSELYRILKPGGKLLLATENLASLPNIAALLLGIAPFSTQHCCSKYRGGWKKGGEDVGLPLNHPAYSGVHGHVRVMTTKQLQELIREAGFTIQHTHKFMLGHYILIEATK